MSTSEIDRLKNTGAPDPDPGSETPENDKKSKSRKFLGIELAPLILPWERRMETVSVAIWISTFLFMGPVCLVILLYLYFYTGYSFIALAYLIYFLRDKDICNRGGRRWKWARNWAFWRNYCNYFPIHLIKTVDLDPSKNYLIGSHPHGVLCSGAFGCFATEGTNFSKVFPGITPHLLTLEGHFSFPLYRDYIMWSGACSASRDSINWILSQPKGGHVACLVPGGAPESLDSHPGPVTKVQMNRRKGFIKMAIRNGAALIPVFSFGETSVYNQVANPKGSKFRRFQDWLQTKIGLAPVLFLGRGIFQYSFGIVPKRHPIYVVVGAPIPTEISNNPTQEAIDTTHEKYVNALVDLFNKYKGLYGDKDDVIQIV